MTAPARHSAPQNAEVSALHRRLAEVEARLERVIAAVERHRDDRSPGADARLYSAVLPQPLEAVDTRVDDPNDWPAP